MQTKKKNPFILFRTLTVIFSPQIVEEHCSVEQSRRAQAEPISLDSCLKAFTSEEELGEDELYYCSKCKTHRLATKKLDLWRLPPILVSRRQFSWRARMIVGNGTVRKQQ